MPYRTERTERSDEKKARLKVMTSGQEGSLGEQLRRLREAAGLSRDELAARAGVSAKAIGTLERGERKRPYPHTVKALADALGLSGEAREAFFGAVWERGAAAEVTPPPKMASALPLPPTRLVGRSREVESVRDLLVGEAARLVTLTGAGGVGKTRLALEVAREVAGDFPDGVAFVPLAPLDDPELVIAEIAGALGVKEAQGRPARDALYARLQDSRLLLVLDNFEHLMGAATEVAALLASCPGPRVLVTSREALGVRGERRFAVPPLAVPELSRLPAPEEVAASEAARLFVERAREVSPGFEITRKNAAAVAAICRRLDGLPLALELAAALVRVLPPREILGRLDETLPLLVGGPRDLPERQRTVRSTVAWSYDLMDEEEKVAFRRLAVFSGGFTLGAAEAVLEPRGRTALELVSSLLDKSLLVADDEPRFGMLETIRAYGLERLEASGEGGEVREQHARFYLALAEAAEEHLIGAGRDAWTERIEAEHDNLRAALSWSIAEGRTELAWLLAGNLFWFWYHGGYWSEGRAWLERALGSVPQTAAPPPAAWIKALYAAGAMPCVQGDYAAASPRLEESAALWRELGDNKGLAYALIFLSIATMGLGELEKARALAGECVALFRRDDDAFGLAAALSAQGVVLRALGEYGEARTALEESAGIAREAGDDWLLALPLRSLGVVTLKQGDLPRAEAYLKESLLLSVRRGGEEYFVAQAMEVLATIAAAQGDHARAVRLYGAAEALREAVGSSILPYDADERERGLTAAHGALGEGSFAAAWAEGRGMTPGQKIAEAVGARTPEK